MILSHDEVSEPFDGLDKHDYEQLQRAMEESDRKVTSVLYGEPKVFPQFRKTHQDTSNASYAASKVDIEVGLGAHSGW